MKYDNFLMDFLTHGKVILPHDRSKHSNHHGLGLNKIYTLANAYKFAKLGHIASLPNLIHMQLLTDPTHLVHKYEYNKAKAWFLSNSEECYGRDVHGTYADNKSDYIVVVLHNTRLVPPQDMMYNHEHGRVHECLVQESLFKNLIKNNKLPCGTHIPLYTIPDLYDSVHISYDSPFGVVFPYVIMENEPKGYVTYEQFVNHPLMLARIGSLADTQDWARTNLNQNSKIGVWHNISFKHLSTNTSDIYYGSRSLYLNKHLGITDFCSTDSVCYALDHLRQ